jgi:hypothetical protein
MLGSAQDHSVHKNVSLVGRSHIWSFHESFSLFYYRGSGPYGVWRDELGAGEKEESLAVVAARGPCGDGALAERSPRRTKRQARS